MNFFKATTTWSNIELSLVKLCVLSAGLIAGCYYHQFLKDYISFIGGVWMLTTLCTVYLWAKKMRLNA